MIYGDFKKVSCDFFFLAQSRVHFYNLATFFSLERFFIYPLNICVRSTVQKVTSQDVPSKGRLKPWPPLPHSPCSPRRKWPRSGTLKPCPRRLCRAPPCRRRRRCPPRTAVLKTKRNINTNSNYLFNDIDVLTCTYVHYRSLIGVNILLETKSAVYCYSAGEVMQFNKLQCSLFECVGICR